MGAQISKNAGKEEAAVEKPAEGAAVAAKANGQVRGGKEKVNIMIIFLLH